MSESHLLNELHLASQAIDHVNLRVQAYQTEHAMAIDYILNSIQVRNNQYQDKSQHIHTTFRELDDMTIIELLHFYRDLSAGMC